MRDEIENRISQLEASYEKLRTDSAEVEKKHALLLSMVREVALSASEAAAKASSAVEKSLEATSKAANAAKDAALVGAIKLAEVALQAARAAADAAGDSAAAAMKAWQAALYIAGHDANTENLAVSMKAHQASIGASAAAIKALDIFSDAFEAVKRTALDRTNVSDSGNPP